jgi:hypothetical protein
MAATRTLAHKQQVAGCRIMFAGPWKNTESHHSGDVCVVENAAAWFYIQNETMLADLW